MTTNRKHLVLVDDEVDNLDMLGTMLSAEYEVTTCTSCPQALNAVVQNPPHLILLDIGMSEINGVQCLERIRSMPGLGNLPAIAVTAFAYPADRERCIAAGFQAFVAKPVIDFAQLLGVIRKYC